MFNKRSVHKKSAGDLPGYKGELYSFLNRPFILTSLAFTILVVLFSLLIYQRHQLLKEARRKEALDLANKVKDKLQETLEHSLSAAKILSFFVDQKGDVTNFDSAASEILNTGNDIDALELMPGGIVKYIYPVKGNEGVIGYDILKDESRNQEAYKAIQKKEMFFAGPFELKQGGTGIVGRLPVFRDNKFWGFSVVIIKMPTLFKAIGINSAGDPGYYFLLSKTDPDLKKEHFFLAEDKKHYGELAASLNVLNGEWKLYIISESIYRQSGDLILLILAGSLVSVLGALFVFSVLRRPKKLDELVKERTLKLRESENKYRSLIERVSDAFVSLDNNWNYTYVNKKAGELLGKDPEKLLGKNIWDEFPQGVDQPYYHVYQRAMESQEYQYTEEYYSRSGKWFENHIYPSEDGLTIFYTDVTGVKKATLALKIKEEKYRSLIEQASDGIVITDLEGHILEVNNSICIMSGYSAEEALGMHLYKFLPAEDTASNPFKFKELMEGKSLLYEGRLLKKDGTVIEIEVNSKMASSHTLIGFIRDITERRKNEETLKYQARLLDVVSDAVTLLDMNRCIISWNKACHELYGFTKEEVMGKRIPELVVFEFPGKTAEEVFKQVFTEGEWKGEFNFMHPRAKIKTYLLSSINLLKNKEGNITGFIITSKDITDRKKAEQEIAKSNERFELIAQATNDAVWDHDFIKNETWGNQTLYNLYGLDAGTAKINLEMFLERIHPDDRTRMMENMRSEIAKRVESISEEFRFRTANDEYRNFYDRAYIKYDADGKASRMLGSMQDITERKAAEENLVEKEKTIEQVLSSTTGNFYVIDRNYVVILINKIAERNLELAWGRSVKPGTNLLEVMPLDEEEPIKENFDKAFAGENIEYEMPHSRLGLPAWSKVRITPVINELGAVIAVSVVAEDISERKAAEVLLKESEANYRIMIEQASDGIFIADTDAYFIDVNTAGCRMLGYTKEELYKLKFPSLIPPGDLMTNPVKFDKMNKGDTVINERRLMRKDGSVIDVETSAKILFDGRFQSIVRDITERKKTYKALQESEERYRALVENAPEALVVFDAEQQKFLSVSQSALKLFRMTEQELLDLGPMAISPEYQPDGRLSSEVIMQNLQKTIQGEKPAFEWIHCDKSGNPIPCEVRLVRLPSENRILIRGSMIDISERKKAEEELFLSEQKYRLLFINNPLPMWMTTIPGLDIIDVNEAAIRQYGYTREEFLKLNAKDLRPAEDVENFVEEIKKMSPGITSTRTKRHKKKDGMIIEVEVYSHEVLYEGKRVLLGLANDVTEKYKARELLQKSYEEIRQLASNLQNIREDERTNIAREIHDELGQQLTGLKMDMYWLSRKIKSGDEEVKKKMQESIQLIDETITSVRKIATDLRPSILDDLGLLAALEWQSGEFQKRSGTKARFINKAGDIKVLPEVATALFRIYQELLTNIARHANAGLVTATLYIVDETLFFSIADNGVGFNLDTINKKKTLGILGIKERTLLIGGSYEIKTRPDKGSETIISIPLNLVKITD